MNKESQRVIKVLLSRCAVDDSSGCMAWTGTTSRKYGKIRFRGALRRVHRVAYEVFVGPIGDAKVLHRCDNPPCFNPDHLFLGSVKDNVQDAIKKGRWKFPPGAGVLGPAERERIASMLKEGMLQREVAKVMGVTQSAISRAMKARAKEKA